MQTTGSGKTLSGLQTLDNKLQIDLEKRKTQGINDIRNTYNTWTGDIKNCQTHYKDNRDYCTSTYQS